MSYRIIFRNSFTSAKYWTFKEVFWKIFVMKFQEVLQRNLKLGKSSTTDALFKYSEIFRSISKPRWSVAVCISFIAFIGHYLSFVLYYMIKNNIDALAFTRFSLTYIFLFLLPKWSSFISSLFWFLIENNVSRECSCSYLDVVGRNCSRNS